MFKNLKLQIVENFTKLATENSHLFYVEVDRDKIWELYINSFDEETAKEYNCSACKSFLRQYSGVIAISNNKRISIWDNVTPVEPFTQFVSSITEYINSLPISDIFYTPQAHCGVDKNFDKVNNTTWDHFFFLAPPKFIKREDTLDSIRGSFRQNRELFKRGLETLTLESMDTVIDLVGQNNLYRGAEFLSLVTSFRQVKIEYDKILTEEEKENYTWETMNKIPNTVLGIRNTVIGSLLVDLSEDKKGIEGSVASYEAKVAPTNYKRTTALVSPRQIQEAKNKLEEMGLLASLDRRFAVATDLELENILFTNSSSNLSDPFEDLTKEVSSQLPIKELNKAEEISIDKFINDVLPTASNLEVYLQNENLSKMVSLITAQNQNSPTLFKWPNLFSWSYTGGITDSIKERVKSAGGQVVGELRVSLSWENFDDLDLWLYCPDGYKIGYNTYRKPARCPNSGQLDVDENAGYGITETPVENIIFDDASKMREGEYTVKVNQYSLRNPNKSGYTVQIECRDVISEFSAATSPKQNGATDTVVKFNYSKADGITFKEGVISTKSTKEKWGLKTNAFVKVNQMMLSPNYWNNAIGNKHYLFILDGCISDEAPIPFFNEFLNNAFTENRKTFEMLAGKFPVPPSDEQLSGLGFSETMPGEIILRVTTNKFKKLLKIKF